MCDYGILGSERVKSAAILNMVYNSVKRVLEGKMGTEG